MSHLVLDFLDDVARCRLDRHSFLETLDKVVQISQIVLLLLRCVDFLHRFLRRLRTFTLVVPCVRALVAEGFLRLLLITCASVRQLEHLIRPVPCSRGLNT